jgi:hypothetical protein
MCTGSEAETSAVFLLVAVCCMFISAKYLEKTYPGYQQLVHITGLQYGYDDFLRIETDILVSLNWEVQYVSVYDVLTHFLCQGFVFSTDELADAPKTNSRSSNLNMKLKAAKHAQKFSEFCAQMCLQYHDFLQYDPVTLACAIVLASRIKLKVKE